MGLEIEGQNARLCFTFLERVNIGDYIGDYIAEKPQNEMFQAG